MPTHFVGRTTPKSPHRDRGCQPTPSGGPRNHLTEIGGADPLFREGPEFTSPRSGVPTHSVGRAPKSPHGDRGCRPTLSGGPRIHLTEIGGCRPTPSGGPRNQPHRDRGADPLRREGPEFTSPSADPLCREGPEITFDPLEVILPQVRGGRGSFYNRGRFCSQCVYLSLDVHEVRASPFSMTTRVIPGRACAAELAVICTLGRDNQLVCASSPVAACPMTVAIGIPPATTSWSRPGHSPSSCGPR